MTDFPLWAHRLFNAPLALERYTNEVLCEFFQLRLIGERTARVGAASLEAHRMQAMSDEASFTSDAGRKTFKFRGDIAVVPVRGKLIHRGDYLDAASGLVGYNRIMEQVRAATNDPEIKGVFMPFDSGGGECAGMFAAAEELASLAKKDSGRIPIHAYLDERACSAAYVLASSCDRVSGRRECMGASISAIINLLDVSKALDNAGIKPIVIRPEWADLKSRPSFGEAVDDETMNEMLAIVDEASDQIVEFVAAMRGVSEKDIRALRGRVLTGEELLKNGLIDGINSEREAWAALEDEARSN